MSVAICITCGAELHPERGAKYAYCTAPECQRENATGLTMVAVGVNKSAEQFEILDNRTRDDMAAGRFHDQRRASYGTPAPAAGVSSRVSTARLATSHPTRQRRNPWSVKQQRRALIYHEQGMRPDEIARRLGVSRYLATQMILAARNQRSA
jgi:ATP phosphoribosyltransferase regulatory subunit HisZ